MVSVGSYVLSAALLALLVGSLGFAAVRVRRRFLPGWDGAPAHLVDAVLGVALLIWLAELLGLLGLLYAETLTAASALLAIAVRFLPGGGVVGGTTPEDALATGRGGGSPAATGPAAERLVPVHPATEQLKAQKIRQWVEQAIEWAPNAIEALPAKVR